MRQSYERLGSFEAPKYISWSSQNRSQLIRVPAAVGDRSRIELRSPDCTCNQYISLALIIAAGLEGIEKKTPLPPSVDLDLYSANEEQTKKLEQLPTSLNEALECAEKSEFVKSIVSEQTLKSYIQEKSADMDPEFWEM